MSLIKTIRELAKCPGGPDSEATSHKVPNHEKEFLREDPTATLDLGPSALEIRSSTLHPPESRVSAAPLWFP